MANRILAKEMQKQSEIMFGKEWQWSLDDCETAIDIFSKAVTEMISRDEKVLIFGFGSFEPKTIKAHLGLDFATQKSIEVPDKKTVKFKAGKDFKTALRGKKNDKMLCKR